MIICTVNTSTKVIMSTGYVSPSTQVIMTTGYARCVSTRTQVISNNDHWVYFRVFLLPLPPASSSCLFLLPLPPAGRRSPILNTTLYIEHLRYQQFRCLMQFRSHCQLPIACCRTLVRPRRDVRSVYNSDMSWVARRRESIIAWVVGDFIRRSSPSMRWNSPMALLRSASRLS